MLEITGYKLLEKIATGGMATVWKARQLSLDRIVAIKILDKNSLLGKNAINRFRKEAQTAARLNHPNIIQVFDAGEIDGQAYLVMEFVEGQSVGEIISIHGTIKEKRALEILEKTAEALKYAWDKECLIHCDVNPNNILIEQDTNHIKITDLGIARLIGLRRRENEDSDLITGTPNYTSPEQSAGINDLDCRTDMYSVGATLYHMVTGVLPFHDAKGSGAMTRHEKDYLDDSVTVNPELSNEVAWLIEKLLIKNRALRPMYWTQAIDDFHEVMQGRLPKPPLPEDGESTMRRDVKRTSVESKKSTSMPILKKKPAAKLALKKADVPDALTASTSAENPVMGAFRTTILLVCLAGIVYAGFYFYGRTKGPPKPVVVPDVVEEVDVVEKTDAVVKRDEVTEKEPEPNDWPSEDFLAGARFFNRALDGYNKYLKNRSNPDILKRVEKNCREAIAYFEACKDDVPEGTDIDQYMTQAYKLLNDAQKSNVGSFSKDESSSVDEALKNKQIQKRQQIEQARRAKQQLLFENKETPSDTEAAPKPEPEGLLKVSLNTGWDSAYSGGVPGKEIGRLLTRHVEPTSQTLVDSTVVLYPGITCMMKAKEAAQAVKMELPLRRGLETPGILTGSLYTYTFEGDFYGARELTIVCDRNDRVVMTQLYDDRTSPSKIQKSLFSSNWSVYDFIGGRKRTDADGQIAHMVRRRSKMIRIDTELAASGSDEEVMATSRVALMMPVRFAGMILQANQ